MFGHISISNFKSIKHVEYDSKKINLFIGEPNSGKSNLLEALALFSPNLIHTGKFNEIFRVNVTADLFFDHEIDKVIEVETGEMSLTFKYVSNFFDCEIKLKDGRQSSFKMDHQYVTQNSTVDSNVNYYAFTSQSDLNYNGNKNGGALASPFGKNLAAVLYSNKEFRKRIGELFREKGFRLEIRPANFELLISKEKDDVLYSYNWNSVSETLRRIVFYMAVLETNKDAVLLLDEPEANTFPFYTQYLAERIALDETNQFFITTHNPYLLSSIISKAPKSDVAVFVTYMENFETKVKPITDDKLSEILDLNSDVFFNLERLLAA